jgi:hypothetical protein
MGRAAKTGLHMASKRLSEPPPSPPRQFGRPQGHLGISYTGQKVKQGDFLDFFKDSTVSEDAGIEPGLLAVRRSNHSARSHPLTRLDLTHLTISAPGCLQNNKA